MATYYYRVPIIGNGTDKNPYRPDIPDNYSWVGNMDGKWYLIKLNSEILPDPTRRRLMPTQEVLNEAIARGIIPDHVLTRWKIGGEV